MAKALIIQTTIGGEIAVIGEHIADGLRHHKIEVDCKDAIDIVDVGAFGGYDVIIFGSNTDLGDMPEEMKNAISIAEKADLQGKVGGAFGLPGCTRETSRRIYDKMKNVFKMKMVTAPLCLETVSSGSAIELANEYGQEIAQKSLFSH